MHRKIVPDIVRDQELAIVSETLSVIDAVRLMAKRRIGAVMVAAGDKLTGIFTERDLATKVVAAELDPAKVSLAQVMTRNPDSISPDDTALNALEMMQARGYRHLPVVKDGHIFGMVSVRDLYAAALDEMAEDLKERDAFIHGTGYGLGN